MRANVPTIAESGGRPDALIVRCSRQETTGTPMPSRIASKTYGTVSTDRQKEMSGLEFVQGLVDGTLPLIR